MNVILLDIDDCIYPSNKNYFGDSKDSLEILKINCNRLDMICKKWDIKIQIISSWCSILEFENNILHYKYINKELYKEEYQVFLIIKEYLEKHVISLSCGNKITDIHNAIENKEFNSVIIIEDTNYSMYVSEKTNSYFLYTNGYISNSHGYHIKNIVRDMENNV